MTAVNLSCLAGAGTQFFDNNGVPLAGGLLSTYAAGTTTPAYTYTTNAGTVQNPLTIVLDASGRVPNEIWLISGSTYKFTLTDANANLIFTKDNIPGSNDYSSIYTALASTSSTSQGAALIGFKQANASGYLSGATARTVQTKLQEVVSVQDFGADPTGANDSTTAFTSALATGLDVFVPNGTYKITSTLTMVTAWQSLYGQGQFSILNFTFATSQPGITLLNDGTSSDAEKATIKNLRLNGVSNCSAVINLKANQVYITNNYITNATSGGHGIYMVNLSTSGTLVYDFGANIFFNYIYGSGTTGGYGIRLGEGNGAPAFICNNNIGGFDTLIYINGTSALLEIRGNWFEPSLNYAINMNAPGNTAGYYNVIIDSNYSEGNPVFVRTNTGFFQCLNITNNYSYSHQQLTPYTAGAFYIGDTGGTPPGGSTNPIIVADNVIENHTCVFQLNDSYNSNFASTFNNSMIGTTTVWSQGTYANNAYTIRPISTYFGGLVVSGSIVSSSVLRLEVQTGTMNFPVVYQQRESAAKITFQYVPNGAAQVVVSLHSVVGITDTTISTVTATTNSTFTLTTPSAPINGAVYYIQAVFSGGTSGYLYPFQLYLYQ